MCIPHNSQQGSVSVPYWATATLDLKWEYMEFLWSLPVLSATNGHPGTGHFTSCNTLGKDTTYVYTPPPISYTPLA